MSLASFSTEVTMLSTLAPLLSTEVTSFSTEVTSLSAEVTSLLDILPTLAHIVTAGDTGGGGNKLDGESLLGTLQGSKNTSERTIFHFCDSEIFALRTQFEDGGTYKLILQEPILTSRGSCEGKNSGKYLFAVYLETISSPALRTWESKLDVCSSSCHDCSTALCLTSCSVSQPRSRHHNKH